jgi:hypothetical protein
VRASLSGYQNYRQFASFRGGASSHEDESELAPNVWSLASLFKLNNAIKSDASQDDEPVKSPLAHKNGRGGAMVKAAKTRRFQWLSPLDTKVVPFAARLMQDDTADQLTLSSDAVESNATVAADENKPSGEEKTAKVVQVSAAPDETELMSEDTSEEETEEDEDESSDVVQDQPLMLPPPSNRTAEPPDSTDASPFVSSGYVSSECSVLLCYPLLLKLIWFLVFSVDLH